jgi:hypothetical protein
MLRAEDEIGFLDICLVFSSRREIPLATAIFLKPSISTVIFTLVSKAVSRNV